MRPWIRRALWLLPAALVLLVLLAAVVSIVLMRGSLPRLEGDAPLPGLSAPATIARDAQGTVTIDAAGETDAMRVLGYVHAQERYFEMDLMRRVPAGELAALFGERALDTDRRHRVHRMRARVESDLEAIAGERLPQLQAYADGVNAGLGDLRVRPWPYLLLRRSPAPWTPADSALTGFAMYFDLQDAGNARELAKWRLRAHLPEPLYALLTHDGSTWDAPLLGGGHGDATLPGPEAVDLRSLPMPEPQGARAASADIPQQAQRAPSPGTVDRALLDGHAARPADLRPGSNNFAVSGRLTADGRALLADDMHLGLRAPNIWFRVRLRYPDPRAPGGRVDVTGFTLPGLPAIVVGSNGHVAWAFTNSYIDTLDWQPVRPCADDVTPDATPDADAGDCTPVVRHRERIAVAGGSLDELQVEETEWGPIAHRQDDGTALALRWAAHLPGALDLGLMDFLRARSLDEALRVADRTAVPTQNLLLADRNGQIAWRLLGPIPRRAPECDGQLPAAPADLAPGHPASGNPAPGAADPDPACAPWPIRTDTSPLLRSPTATRLWTANSRVVGGADQRRLGDGGAALGARAQQIRDALRATDRFDEHALLEIQLDDRAILLTRWWTLLQQEAGRPLADASGRTDAVAPTAPAPAQTSPALHTLAAAAGAWSGHADIDSAAYRLVRAWRLAVHRRIAEGLAAPALAALDDDTFALPGLPNLEGVAWPLLQARPAHLLPRAFACAQRGDTTAGCDDARDGWTALLEDAAREVVDTAQADGPLTAWTWGARNTTAICHPLAAAVPWLGRRLLCMPAQALPGDSGMPRVQGPSFGASQRMVVAPGHEADGIAHMPGGQSGHPLSPFWGAGHDDWAAGRASPFLPGAARHTLSLHAPSAEGASR